MKYIVLFLLFFNVFISHSLFADSFYITKQTPINDFKINTNPHDLCKVANNTVNYLSLGKQYDAAVIHANKLSEYGISEDDLSRTLKSLCTFAKADEKNNTKSLTDIQFLKKHYDFYRISSDTTHAKKLSDKKPLLKNLTNDKVLMTKYYVHLATGSDVKTTEYTYPLYALPFDEAGLSLEEAERKKQQLTRFKYGKQEILSGILTQQNLAKPIIYLTREDLESALLQGTIVVEINGEQRVFNVHRNNGIAYDRTIKPFEQNRYWYFKQVNGILGYGKDANHKIEVLPEVTFAGDIYQLGLGALVFAKFDFKSHSEYRMAVMADTGGAFEDNLYQLDYLAGSYPGIKAYYDANRHMPDYIDAWFMILKGDIK
ncbi:MltA domain-containing protein [Pseudoalteromonas sp. SSM20]|uniref:MltA domain-containing protein n=1 Tax=Pseudoalteromonas sp. SSM20 TaxID=3139394 RepID=UPI003BAA6A04